MSLQVQGQLEVPSWHPAPLRPGGQRQRYPLISSTHVAPKAQGEDWHSLISVMGRKRKKILLYSTFYFVRKKKKKICEIRLLELCVHFLVSTQGQILISSTGIIPEQVL